MAELKSPTSEQPKSKVSFEGETRNKSESVLFLAPGKSDGYKSETHWFCKLGQDEFEMDLTSSNATFTSLKHMLEDTYRCILKRVRRGSFIFECKHESRENAVKMMKDHAKVKDTILRCLHDMDPRVNAIRVDVEYREDHVEIDPPQLLETGHQAKGYVNKEEFDRIVAALQQKQSETLEKLNELKQAQLAVTATETITDVSEDQFQATEDLSEAEGGHRHRGGVSKPRQKSESVIRLKRQLADLKQELKATTDRMHRLETTHKKATPTPADRDPEADRDLLEASREGNMAAVKRILAAGRADVNSRGVVGLTPVMSTAHGGHRDVVELLVSEGADVSLVDEDGTNILHYACWGGDVETVKFVLSLNVVDINCRGRGSRTPVMAAAFKGHRDVVELLMSEGADVSPVDGDGNNILHYACIGGDVETVKFVLSLNVVDIDARNNLGLTAADVARREGHKKNVKLLKPPRCHVM
ncbi:death-associated protein kinase 1-like [Haliotis rufescens]|uniref:death-associated protein kinase 1-like n=1 Tax=Haliotis rufescens TaxID=6454 RepID=UPI00201EF667|nr:death-associated protein kinase 1-like [Haliotis rufescens]